MSAYLKSLTLEPIVDTIISSNSSVDENLLAPTTSTVHEPLESLAQEPASSEQVAAVNVSNDEKETIESGLEIEKSDEGHDGEENQEDMIENPNNKAYKAHRDLRSQDFKDKPYSERAGKASKAKLDEAEIRERVKRSLKKSSKIPGKKRNSAKAASRRDANDAMKSSSNWN
jgi:hypothetical protein